MSDENKNKVGGMFDWMQEGQQKLLDLLDRIEKNGVTVEGTAHQTGVDPTLGTPSWVFSYKIRLPPK
jgi:hypothetical protein